LLRANDVEQEATSKSEELDGITALRR
jgi:hypothetical protein